MADKMMRVAGRGEDGNAKSFQTTNAGILKTALTTKKVFNSITIPASAELVPIIINVENYHSFRLAATGNASGMTGLEFYYSTADYEGGLFNQDRAYVLGEKLGNFGLTRNFHTKDFPLHGRFLGIKIKNTSSADRTPHSITITLKQDGNIDEPTPEIRVVEPHGAKLNYITALGAFEVKGAFSLVMHVEPGLETNRGFFVEGRTQSGAYSRIPAIDTKRMLRTDTLNEAGVFYWNTSGLDYVRIVKYSGSDTTKMFAYLSTTPAPEAIDAPVRYRRITPEDMEVTGKFRAIEPLTDITLHANTQLLAEYSSSTSNPLNIVFKNGDTRLAGQTLFGPFGRVRITSGEALLVLL